jgi:hypothetical protein
MVLSVALSAIPSLLHTCIHKAQTLPSKRCMTRSWGHQTVAFLLLGHLKLTKSNVIDNLRWPTAKCSTQQSYVQMEKVGKDIRSSGILDGFLDDGVRAGTLCSEV